MVKSLTGADMSVGRVDCIQREKIRNKDGLLIHYTQLIEAIKHISNGPCIYIYIVKVFSTITCTCSYKICSLKI